MMTKTEVEELTVVLLAALFRAAGIARASDSTSTESNRDYLAIDQAQNFIQACKTRGIWEKTP